MPQGPIRLVARADDAGSCRSANEAIRQTVSEGIVRNVSVMAVGPAFEEAAEMLRGLEGVCVGLHATINAEWDEVKWPPVLPRRRVRSLVDESGCLLASPRLNHQRGADPDELLAEIEAQLGRMRAAGLNVEYFDEHMGFDWLDGVADRLAEFARRERLLRGRGTVGRLPKVSGEFDDPADELTARLAAAGPGAYLVVAHPGLDAADMRRFGHAGLAAGEVARRRDAERRMFISAKVLACCRARGVELARYCDVLEA